MEFVDDPTTLARASQVSKKWRELVNDDSAWRLLCQKYSYRGLSREERGEEEEQLEDTENSFGSSSNSNSNSSSSNQNSQQRWTHPSSRLARPGEDPPRPQSELLQPPPPTTESLRTQSLDRSAKRGGTVRHRRPKATTYRSHFKQRYMVETAWRSGGVCDARQITPDPGVVTSLHLTKKYIVVALDNAKIHVFDTNGEHQKTLQGHLMGVWAMVPWGDLLVSGGCDRDVRVWDLATGYVVSSP